MSIFVKKKKHYNSKYYSFLIQIEIGSMIEFELEATQKVGNGNIDHRIMNGIGPTDFVITFNCLL